MPKRYSQTNISLTSIYSWHFFAILIGLSCLVIISALSLSKKESILSETSASVEYSGYITSKNEIQQLKNKISAGDLTLKTKVDNLVTFAGTPSYWPYGSISGPLTVTGTGTCGSAQDATGPDYLKYNYGARLIYAKVLAYHFTGNIEYAKFARDRIIELTSTNTFGGDVYNGANQCVLELAFSMPLWVQSADLLDNTSVWSVADKQQFQNWLAGEVYTKVAWASRRRANNWGAAGSASAAIIADYVESQNPSLEEVSPVTKTLSARAAYLEHIQQQKDRMTGVFQGDSGCSIWGIQSHGGIPDELRRGAAGCTADSLQTADNSLVYQITHVDFLIITAEFLWHRGDTSIYNLLAANGQGSLKNAINFVINNPKNAPGVTWESYRTNHLSVANRYYHDSVMRSVANSTPNDAKGTFIAFSHITHHDEYSKPISDIITTINPTQNISPTAPITPTKTLIPTSTTAISPTLAPSPIPTSVSDVNPPVITIFTPRDKAKVNSNLVEISVSANDNVKVAQMDLSIDGVKKETTTEASFTFLWNTDVVKKGRHTISVTAIDGSGNQSSKSISVTK